MRHGHGMMRRLDDETPPIRDHYKLIRNIGPLLWPEKVNLRARLFLCALTIIMARVANIMVPQFYKGAVDSLAGAGNRKVGMCSYSVPTPPLCHAYACTHRQRFVCAAERGNGLIKGMSFCHGGGCEQDFPLSTFFSIRALRFCKA